MENNNLTTINNMLSNLSSEDMSMIMMNQMLSRIEQVNQLASDTMRRQTELELRTSKKFDDMENQTNTTNDKLNDIEKKAQEALNMSASRKHIDQIVDGYVNQSDLGAHFKVNISSIRIGKLLKIVGLAQKTRNTQPYFEYVPNYAKKRTTLDGHIHYRWNQKKCIDKIDKWLEKNGLLHEFYIIEHENDMSQFIDQLYDKYVLSGGQENA